MAPSKKPTQTYVPENVLLKQKRDNTVAKQRQEQRIAQKNLNTQRKAEWLANAQKYQKEYTDNERNDITQKRQAKAKGAFYVPAESKIALVIRIRGVNNLHPDTIKILRLFRLRQLHNATFVRVNKATTNMLKKVLPMVTFGYPTRKTISDLIYKRGFGKINKQRIPLTSNAVIEKGLGKFGITSIEDLVHEIVTVGPNFKEANNFIWTFKLAPPKGGFNNKRHPFQTGGDWGNREQFINQMVSQML